MSSMHFQLKHTLLAVISSLTLSLFPLLFFFNFLYYTDVGSTLTVLLGYLMSRQDRHLLASLVSHVTCGCHGNAYNFQSLGLSIFFRQTNIVWAVFVGGASLLRYLEPELSKSKSQYHYYLICPWKRCFLHIDSLSLFHQLFLLLRSALYNLPTILSWAWSYLLLGIGFIIFIINNDGIVLGDKTHHTVSVHIPQVFYYSW